MLAIKDLSRFNVQSCVHCGFCLEACPTYRELGIEDDSPRGRIHLIRALLDGRVEATPKVLEHQDLCLHLPVGRQLRSHYRRSPRPA